MTGMHDLFDFSGGAAATGWIMVDDDVMGGHSRSAAAIDDGVLRFSGTLSLEDNGGFASIRARAAFDLSSASAIGLRVRGDGRTYELRLSTDARHRGSRVSWRGDIATTAGEWREVEVVFDRMRPTYRGTVLDGPALALDRIEEIGLLVGDGLAGVFALEVAWMRLVDAPEGQASR